ncbi:MAG: hypothetical protein ACREAA_08150 [Candidatus Polarisedimenticolia bacterium]
MTGEMMRGGRVVVLAALVFFSATGAQAKDVRRLWFVGGTIGYHTTADAVENNASLANDPRPDDFVSRELTLDDTIQAGLHVGFGLTGSFTLQLETGYYKGNVGSVDVYREESFPGSNVGDPFNLTIAMSRDISEPFTAGEMTQIPVSLTGLMRFRKDSALNPFIGAGVGKVFLEFQPADELFGVNRTIDSLHVKRMRNEAGTNITPQFFEDRFVDDGLQPALDLYSLSFEVEDSWEWHLSVGLEYALSDRVGLVADARYVFYQSTFALAFSGEGTAVGPGGVASLGHTGPEDQVNFEYWPTALYHPDGSLRVFNNLGNAPNTRNPADPDGLRFRCTKGEIRDIDGNNLVDACYDAALVEPRGLMIVQAGEIDLSGYIVQLGLRWYF